MAKYLPTLMILK